MLEKDFNRILSRNLNEAGFAFKIPDPRKGMSEMSAKNPFDLFGLTSEYIIYAESKLIKNKWQAWNFKTIEDHQYYYMGRISELAKNHPNVIACFILAIWIPRKEFCFFVFDSKLIAGLKESGKKSFLKNELLEFKERGFAIQINKEKFDVNLIKEKIISGI